MEIVENVHLIDRVRGANCYLVTGPELTLIDTGMPGQAKRIVSYISGLGYAAADLKRIILTHHDVDHVGSAAGLQRLIRAEVCMHRADVECVLGRSPRRPFWKAWLWSLARLWPGFQPPDITLLLEDGQNVGPFQVIHTPGHSAGSISLKYGPVLFAGDLLRWGPLGKETFPLANEDNGLARASIKKMAQLDFDILCPGHGKPVSNAGPKVRALAARWAEGDFAVKHRYSDYRRGR